MTGAKKSVSNRFGVCYNYFVNKADRESRELGLMDNPICVQVNIFHPIDDYIGGDSEMDFEDALDYVYDYVHGLPRETLDDEADGTIATLVDYLMSGMPMIAEFRQRAFKDALSEWADLHGKTVEEMVRGYVDNGWGSFQMIHGFGYDWMSADLFGGSSDGKARTEFEKWAGEELNLHFVF